MDELGSRTLVLGEEVKYVVGVDLAPVTDNRNDYSAVFMSGRRIGKSTTMLNALSAEVESQNRSIPTPSFTRQTLREGFEILNRDPVVRQTLQDNAVRQMQQEEDEAIIRDISLVSTPTDPTTRIMESTPRSTPAPRLFDTEPIRFRDRGVLETGYFYASYFPLQTTPTVSIPDTMEKLRGKLVYRYTYVLGDRALDMGD
jgi:hypothetical protein